MFLVRASAEDIATTSFFPSFSTSTMQAGLLFQILQEATLNILVFYFLCPPSALSFFPPIFIYLIIKSVIQVASLNTSTYSCHQFIKYFTSNTIIIEQSKMDTKINLIELSIDQITRKIKAFKNDANLIGLTLYVRRKENIKSSKNRQGQPHNVDNLLQQRKTFKESRLDSDEDRPHGKENTKSHHDFTTYLTSQRKQAIFSNEYSKGPSEKVDLKLEVKEKEASFEGDSFDFIHDQRMGRATKNYTEGNYDMAISLLSELLEEVRMGVWKSPDQVEGDKERRIASITFHLANSHYRKKNFEKAIEYYSLQIPEQNYKRKAMRKSNLGAIYLQLNKNQESLRNYTQALKIYSQCGCDSMDLSNTYHNVGNIYMREKMYQIASKYFQMSIEERKSKSPEAELPLFYSAFKLGVSQKFEQKYQESIQTLLYALSFAERGVGDIVEVYKQVAVTYELLGKQNEALNYYQKICDCGKSTEEDRGYAYERASVIYMNSQQYSESERIMKIAEQCYCRAGNEKKVIEIRQRNKQKSIQS